MKLLFSILLLFVSTSQKKCDRSIVYGENCSVKFQKCVDLIKHYERFRAKPYGLLGDRYIGYGHLIRKNEIFTILTERQADSILKLDFGKGIKYAPDSFIYEKKLFAGMYAYNCGVGNMKRLFKKPVSEELYLSCCHVKGKFHKGLHERRKKEYELTN